MVNGGYINILLASIATAKQILTLEHEVCGRRRGNPLFPVGDDPNSAENPSAHEVDEEDVGFVESVVSGRGSGRLRLSAAAFDTSPDALSEAPPTRRSSLRKSGRENRCLSTRLDRN